MRGRGTFDEEEDFKRERSGGDTEFTLGAGTLVLVAAGLVVVCGICFGLGYMLGRRGAGLDAARQVIDTQPGSQASDLLQKPSASTQQPATEGAAPAELPQSAADPANPSSSALSEAQTDSKQQVSPALPESAAATQPVRQPEHQPAPQSSSQVRSQPVPQAASQSATALYTRPAESVSQSQTRHAPVSSPAPRPSMAGLWVQVAAVSHVEDAAVLTTALRKRGYVVTPRRESDNLIHVRIGPFNTRDEANRWSMKLLDDGYNAEVQ